MLLKYKLDTSAKIPTQQAVTRTNINSHFSGTLMPTDLQKSCENNIAPELMYESAVDIYIAMIPTTNNPLKPTSR